MTAKQTDYWPYHHDTNSPPAIYHEKAPDASAFHVGDLVEAAVACNALNFLTGWLQEYGTHKDDCDLNTRRRMHPVAEKTMDDVFGPAKCTCGWQEVKSGL